MTMRQFTLATTIITMYQLHLTSLLVGSFTPHPITPPTPFSRTPTTTALFSSSTTIPSETINKAKRNVLDVSRRLFSESPTGVFIRTPSAIKELKKVVSELEAISPSPSSIAPKLMMGDWKLVVTANFPARGGGDFGLGRTTDDEKKKSSSPFGLLPDPLNLKTVIEETRNKLRDNVEVIQRIRSFDWNDDTLDDAPTYLAGSGLLAKDDKFNRIDNVISFTPFNLLDSTTSSSSSSLDLTNPLEISSSKVTLAHKAAVKSVTPVLRTALSLKNVIVTVAGTSRYLEPEGADVLGLNVPSLSEFLNAGTFDTTYVDGEVRISRGTVGFVEQLRVFVKKSDDDVVVATEEEEEEEVVDEITAVGDVVVEDEVDEITVDDDDDDDDEETDEDETVDDEEIVDVVEDEASVDGEDDEEEQRLDSDDDEEETRL